MADPSVRRHHLWSGNPRRRAALLWSLGLGALLMPLAPGRSQVAGPAQGMVPPGAAVPAQGQLWQQRQAWMRQEAEALLRLNPSQGKAFFAARRDLERRFSGRRLTLLDQAERCLGQARDGTAMEACQRQDLQARMQLHREEMDAARQLKQRYGLPVWERPMGRPERGPRPAGEARPR